ncbi:site-specific integrase [Microbacterium sp. zg.B48]|uniref:tyrosine-type recombinase/integrase n=1 Tax=Microbacterium sp. zg.B48 TaxID=2969408 RepID=UPI00214C0180|nr:site-specific integrase [Microbacterium sp. zg.B48]MCR2764972.1 site-specific integrase [Microbacterium sp. zg.B48]
MGSIAAYTTKQGRRYRVRYRRPDGTQTDRRGFTTKRDAELFLSTVEVAKAKGEFIDVSAAEAKVGALGTSWIASRQQILKPSTFRSLESSWRIHVLPRWGTRAIGSIRHSEIQAWISEMAQTQSATNVLRAHGILAAIFDTAVKDRSLAANPARDVGVPRKGRKGKAYLTHAQVELLARSAAEPTLVRFLAYTGLRWGEATALRIRHLDLQRRRASIEENAVMVNNTVIMGTPKTHKTRSVPLPAFLVEELRLRVQARDRDAYVFGDGAEPLRLPNSKAGWFAGAVRRAQQADPNLPRVTPHALRHTAASLAVSAGANVKAVQRMLGHASAAMTLDTYSDLFDDDLDAVSDALDRARSRAI